MALLGRYSVLHLTLIILHIATAAAWFGLGLRIAGRARSIIETNGPARVALAEDGARSVWLMNVFMVLTLVFSVAAFVVGGHFNTYGPAYHSALTFIVILTLIQFFVIRPGWGTLQANADPDAGDADAAASATSKVAIGTGVGHLLWLVLLGLMFWDQFAAAL
jgi:hypothetical protein